MNAFPCLRTAFLVLVTILAPTLARSAEAERGCIARPVPTDSQVVTCILAPATIGVPMRFVATFIGSHDDTRIRLDATVDGRPVACDAGSRTSLFAEDGVVQLDCRFRAPSAAASSAPASLEVALRVHHAQYESSSLDPH